MSWVEGLTIDAAALLDAAIDVSRGNKKHQIIFGKMQNDLYAAFDEYCESAA